MFGHTLIPLRRFPQVFPVVTSILLVQTVVFIMILLTGHAGNQATWVQYGAFEAWRVNEGEYWRLLSSLFVHAHFLHYLFNSFCLYIFAPQLEWLLGRMCFLMLYIGSGLIGNYGLILFELDIIYAGASVSIYGFLGVYLYLYFRKMIDPNSGKGLLILTLINLLFHYHLIFPHLLALVSGFLLGAMIIFMKQMRMHD